MNQLEQLENAEIVAADYHAPTTATTDSRFAPTGAHYALAALAILCLMFIAFITLARSVQVLAVTPELSSLNTVAQGDLQTKLTPVAADITISGLIKLPLGNRVLMLPGARTVSVSAEGYQAIEQSLEIGSSRHQQFEIVLTRLPGKLKINLLGPDQQQLTISAPVMIDGEAIAELPGVIDNVAAGQRQVTVDAPLYRAASESLLIEGKGKTQTLNFTLQPAWAEYAFSTTPDGAELIVDEEPVAKTPATIRLEEGLRKVVIKAPGFKPFTQDVGVVAQQNITVPMIELIPADGVLALSSKPDNASVILNGEYRGTTPLKLSVSPGQEQRVQLYKAGYKLNEQSLSLAPDELAEKNIALQSDLVSVRISVTPSDASVYVDGVKRGQGSQTLSLTTLPHTISVRKPGYVSQNNDLIPTRGSKQIVSINLLTKEQHYWAQLPNTYTNRAGHEMKLFKAPGKVLMGSSRRENGRRANEVQYTAELTKPFYVGLYETTNKQFRAFKKTHNAGNYKKKSLDANKAPAVNISWQEAALYCNWLSKREKLDPFYQTKSGFVSGNNPDANGYRLLTEAEWAWLARNKDGKVLRYPWGETASVAKGARVGNFADKQASDLIAFTLDGYDDGYRGTAPVGRYPANHRGIYDIAGNAAEWVNDWYGAQGSKELRGNNALKDPLGPEIGEFHTVRGASWARGHLPQLRLAYRDYGAKGKHDIGFRVARYAGLTKGGAQ